MRLLRFDLLLLNYQPLARLGSLLEKLGQARGEGLLFGDLREELFPRSGLHALALELLLVRGALGHMLGLVILAEILSVVVAALAAAARALVRRRGGALVGVLAILHLTSAILIILGQGSTTVRGV